MTASGVARSDLDLPLVLTHLFKGVVERESQEQVWRHLVQLQAQVRDFVSAIGLTVVVDETEGYAFLRSAPEDPDNPTGLPRLVARRPLSFHLSLLLALLRKRLAQAEAESGDPRVILTRDQIVELHRVFLPSASNEARLVDQVDSQIAKAVDLGFLRRVSPAERTYEVRRILKAFVDAQWLHDLDVRLAEYAATLEPSRGDAAPVGEKA